ncbi:hypothetical protein [Streptomyces sp. NPDC058629]|uniref:hypothetical protein n=1 Tax=Streptomyces sp. NPDC058629 TaxID=3346565 RepID=UPI00364A5608
MSSARLFSCNDRGHGRRLDALDATRLVLRTDCEPHFEEPAEQWLGQVVTSLTSAAAASRPPPPPSRRHRRPHQDIPVRHPPHRQQTSPVSPPSCSGPVQVFVQRSPHFRPPSDPAIPMVMVGPGADH